MATIEEVLGRAGEAPVIVVSAEELAALKGAGDLLRSTKTSIGGPMEVLGVGGAVLFHEVMPDGRLLIRKMFDLGSADALIADRRETYDDMWEGCAVKPDYGIR